MIWVAGRLVEDDALKVSIWDRTFEHGLGLFETLRTWNGQPTLLDRHIARLKSSADRLGLPIVPEMLPGSDDVRTLHAASGLSGDAVFRITLTGGLSEDASSVLWMRAAPLPPPISTGARIRSTWTMPADDELARYKTLNYWRRRRLYERARAEGFDEDLGRIGNDAICEGTRTNVFVAFPGRAPTHPRLHLSPSAGRGRPQGGRVRGPAEAGRDPNTDGYLDTPEESGDYLAGIMRQVVLDAWQDRYGPMQGAGLVTPEDLYSASEVFLTNSVRGIIPVRSFEWCGPDGDVRVTSYPSPGPLTRRLWDDILPWLEAGGPPR